MSKGGFKGRFILLEKEDEKVRGLIGVTDLDDFTHLLFILDSDKVTFHTRGCLFPIRMICLDSSFRVLSNDVYDTGLSSIELPKGTKYVIETKRSNFKDLEIGDELPNLFDFIDNERSIHDLNRQSQYYDLEGELEFLLQSTQRAAESYIDVFYHVYFDTPSDSLNPSTFDEKEIRNHAFEKFIRELKKGNILPFSPFFRSTEFFKRVLTRLQLEHPEWGLEEESVDNAFVVNITGERENGLRETC